MVFLSIILLCIGVYFLHLSSYKLLQSFGFAFTVIGLVQTYDTRRYFLIFIWNIFVTLGSCFGLYENLISWDIFGVTISFAILSVATLIFYLKLLPEYIRRFKNVIRHVDI